MQIHELNNYNGDFDSNAYIAVDNGNDTGKTSIPSVLAETNAKISQLDTDLNDRIDNIVAGGAAPSAAEVTDARYGANGVTYTSLGAAIRSQVDDLNSALSEIANDAYKETAKPINTTVTGWRLNQSDGLCSENANYKMDKYSVTAGDFIKVESDDRFQFQSVASVPSTGTSNRVGNTMGAGTYYLIVPNGATYLIISTPKTDSTAKCYNLTPFIEESFPKYEAGWNNLFDGDEIPIKYLCSFRRGAARSDGTVASWSWRIVSPDILYTDREIELTVSVPGFRFYVSYYTSDGIWTSESGWNTASYIVPKGSHYRVTIARVTENESETADIDIFATSVNVSSLFSNVTDTVYGYELASQNNLVIGTFETDHIVSNEPKRARTGYIYVNQPTEFAVTPNDDYYWLVKGSNLINDVLQDVESYIPSWNHTAQTLILQKGIYVLVVANGSTYGSSTNYDISNPSIRFSFTALSLADAITEAMSGSENNEILTSKYAVELPNYWEEYMQTKLPDVIAQVRSAAMTGDSFVFFTDYHIEFNSGNSHLLMNRILDNTPLDMVVFGGDIMNGSATKAESYAKCQEFAQRFRKLPMFGIRGNHEYNLDDGGSASVKFSENDIYNYLIKQSERKIKGPGKMYYYVDNEPQKIRYIFLDSKNQYGYDDYPMDDAQIAWLTAILSELNDKWKVVIFVHQFMGKSYEDHTWYVTENGERIENAIAESNTDATICAIISGHWHEDYSMKKNGVPYIVTTWDGYYADSNRTRGTSTELAFDVFTINSSDKTIKTTRIGYGEDRSWTYGE